MFVTLIKDWIISAVLKYINFPITETFMANRAIHTGSIDLY